MKKTVISLCVAVAASALALSVAAATVESLRGDKGVESMSEKPIKAKVVVVQGGVERNYKQQPPIVPHEIKPTYRISLKNNGCMKCHGPKTYKKEKAPMVGESHFLTRDGKKLDHVSSRRYFCTQCHVPQLSGTPLVENTFEGVKQ